MEYFQEQSILKKLLKGFAEKYRSFGCIAGSVRLTNLKQDEIEVLEGVFGKNYHGKKSVSISAVSLQKVLNESKFQGIQAEDLLHFMIGDKLQSKKELLEEELQRQSVFLEEVTGYYQNTLIKDWLEEAGQSKNATWKTILQKYHKDETNVKEELRNIAKAMSDLPVFIKRFEYLPLFASKITGDPHYFDEGKEALTLFQNAIYYYLKDGEKRSGRLTGEERQEFFLRVGILKDDISNNVLAYGIQGVKGNHLHAGIEGFYKEKEPLQMTLLTISQIYKFTCHNKRLFVVENPIVFAKLAEEANEHCGLVCVNGQPNLAVLVLLDKLAEDGTQIFYAGDFDPEGLLIAQRLKMRYQEQLKFWHYDLSDYEMALSSKEISNKRLKMLEKLKSPQLQQIAEQMKIEKKAGYQEMLMQKYLEEVRKLP